MNQARPKTERVGEIAAKSVVLLLSSTGKSVTVDGLREKLREFYRQEVRSELRAVAALSIVVLIAALLSCNRQLALVGLQLRKQKWRPYQPTTKIRRCPQIGTSSITFQKLKSESVQRLEQAHLSAELPL